MPRSALFRLVICAFVGCIVSASSLDAQNATSTQLGTNKDVRQSDPLKRTPSAKERKKQAQALKKELSAAYKSWIEDDVAGIITDEEREAFRKLSTDEERDQFIEMFWVNRDPTPDTPENEAREEHYRRIAYANEHYAAGIPGSKTDRGRMYIVWGPPDEIESHPSGGTYMRTPEEGGGETTTHPFERWRYRHLEGVGDDVVLEFVDDCGCGKYEMTIDPSRKDALLHVPGGGPTLAEQTGQETRADRLRNGGLGRDPFTKLAEFAAVNRPPVRFKELEREVVSHTMRVNVVPFEVRTDFIKLTTDTDMVPVTIAIRNSDITFATKDGVATGVVNIFGRVTNMTGRVVQTFEDTVQRQEPAELLPKVAQTASIYGKSLLLRPGRHKLEVAVKDVNGDRVGVVTRSMPVPQFSDERLASSSLILADQMERVPIAVVGSGPFVVGSMKVRPRVQTDDKHPATFQRGEKLHVWMQVYNLGIDAEKKRPKAIFEYDITEVATRRSVLHARESTGEMTNPGEQITLQKTWPLAQLPPGIYRVTVTAKDDVAGQSLTQTAQFAVQ